MYIFSKLVWLFIQPFNLFLVGLIVGGTLAAWTRGSFRRAGRWLFGATLAAFLFLNFVPIGTWAVVSLESRFPVLHEVPDQVDGILILGGMFNAALSEAHGTPSLNESADRLWAGMELARRYPEAKVIFTGGNGLPLVKAQAEADLAERVFRASGLTGTRMIFERNSRNTRENATLSKELAKPSAKDNWLLVTSAIHMPRAYGAFSAVKWMVIPYPVDHVTGGKYDAIGNFSMIRQLTYLNRAMHEWAGLAYYHWQGWTTALFPGPSQSG